MSDLGAEGGMVDENMVVKTPYGTMTVGELIASVPDLKPLKRPWKGGDVYLLFMPEWADWNHHDHWHHTLRLAKDRETGRIEWSLAPYQIPSFGDTEASGEAETVRDAVMAAMVAWDRSPYRAAKPGEEPSPHPLDVMVQMTGQLVEQAGDIFDPPNKTLH